MRMLVRNEAKTMIRLRLFEEIKNGTWDDTWLG